MMPDVDNNPRSPPEEYKFQTKISPSDPLQLSEDKHKNTTKKLIWEICLTSRA